HSLLPTSHLQSFCLLRFPLHLHLHSFPTRRSSDLENPTYLKLRPVQDSKLDRLVAPLLCPGEEIVQTFQSVRDGVVFTTRRVIADRKSTRLNSSHVSISYAVFCLKQKKCKENHCCI